MLRFHPAFLITLFLTGTAFAQKDQDTWTDPEDVPASYAVQGEYLGEVDGKKTGLQIIALGGDEFELVGYPGGLPGDGWNRGDKQIKGLKSKLADDGTLTFTHEDKSATLKDGTFTFSEGSAKRMVRKSPTLGAKPPEGATVLFDGTSAEAWKGGRITMGNLLAADTESVQKFGDHSFHLEFRTPFKPKARGQARGNSGVYLQGRYEVQVLDSFGLEGENNECGGIYQIGKPIVNMCYPPLTWQTYDVDFTDAVYEDGKKVKNARVTIRHNGVVIHDDLELPKNTPGKYGEADEPGPIYLQGHGNPVVYRNVWVVAK